MEIPPYVSILSWIEIIWCGKEALRDEIIPRIIEDLYGRQRLGGFNKN